MTKALVIDDNRETADAINQMLGFLEVESYVAYGPRSALMILKDLSPDILFLDISMPGVDGFEVMSYLRRSPQLHQVPIIVITADSQPETARKVQENGGLLTIVKPVTLELLENTLREAGFWKTDEVIIGG